MEEHARVQKQIEKNRKDAESRAADPVTNMSGPGRWKNDVSYGEEEEIDMYEGG